MSLMRDITKNEIAIALCIFKSPEVEYNANSIAKVIGITPMGALKILKHLEKDGILVSKEMGKSIFYKINFENVYARNYIKFLLEREREQTSSYIKRWVTEIKKIKNADIAILFGSILKKEKEASDIDLLLVTNKNKFSDLKNEIIEINKISEKKLHPIYQTFQDLKVNIKKQDKVILNTIKGIVVFGEERIINAFM